MPRVESAGMLLMMACWKNCLKTKDRPCQKTCLETNYTGEKCVEVFGRICVGCPTVAFRFSKKTAGEKQWTREEYALGAAVSGHGPTHFAADELGNHGNAHTDARNISSFAWAKEGM